MMEDRKITSFTDLKVWQESHKLALMIYKATEKFPKDEQFGLSSQLKRASSSVTSNIAEGFGRSTGKDKEHFFVMASGSIYEVKSQLILTKDLAYITIEHFQAIANQANTAHKLLHGLLRAHKATNV